MNSARQVEWISWGFVLTIAVTAAVGWLIGCAMEAWHHAHDNLMLTEAGRVCIMRGHHVDQDEPGDTKKCQQCGHVRRRDTCNVGLCDRLGMWVYPRHPSGSPFYVCDLHGADVRRYTDISRDAS